MRGPNFTAFQSSCISQTLTLARHDLASYALANFPAFALAPFLDLVVRKLGSGGAPRSVAPDPLVQEHACGPLASKCLSRRLEPATIQLPAEARMSC
jgi:hypothetical protein